MNIFAVILLDKCDHTISKCITSERCATKKWCATLCHSCDLYSATIFVVWLLCWHNRWIKIHRLLSRCRGYSSVELRHAKFDSSTILLEMTAYHTALFCCHCTKGLSEQHRSGRKMATENDEAPRHGSLDGESFKALTKIIIATKLYLFPRPEISSPLSGKIVEEFYDAYSW